MDTMKDMGLIECRPGENFQPEQLGDLKEYHLKKVMMRDTSSEETFKRRYPQAEIVNDPRSIIHDHSIELVIVSAPSATDMHMVGEVLQAGKHVRIL